MNFETERLKMVSDTIARRGVRDPKVLDAVRSVPRHAFIPGNLREFAYRDSPLPIGEEQTISQPYIVAVMAEAARLGPKDRVLEIGTGSGYGAAILSRVASSVDTVERHKSLALSAQSESSTHSVMEIDSSMHFRMHA